MNNPTATGEGRTGIADRDLNTRVSQPDCDVLVVGGGLVGASLAMALSPLGLRVTLLEAMPPRAPAPPSFDDRTLALGTASVRILEGIGLWPDLAENATPIRQVTVTERGRPGRVVMDAAAMGLDRFGNVVEARVFGAAAMAKVATLPGVNVCCPARAESLSQDDHSVTVDGSLDGTPARWTARLVIGADGAASKVRDMVGIGAREHDYEQAAIICNVTPELAHGNRAFERMTPTGPFALLPHAGKRCGLVWCAPSEAANDLLECDDEGFLARATERSGGVLGRLLRCGKRSHYPLRRVAPLRDREGRVLLLGNAAHAIHPVGAQGFNLGLRDIAVLAELIADAQLSGAEDPGDRALLDAYVAWRQPDREATMGWSHDMVRLFASSSRLTRTARSAALAVVGLSPALQRRMASRAMGYRGRVPRLALGEALQRTWPPSP